MPCLRKIELRGGPDDGYRGNCPDGCCMTLGHRGPDVTASMPPKKAIICLACGHNDFRVA